MAELEALLAAFNAKQALRAHADQRFKQLSEQTVEAAEDPPALEEIEKSLGALRHEISALDVEIAELERQISDAGGPNV